MRLAHVVGAQGDNTLLGLRGVPRTKLRPAILVAYPYLAGFERVRARLSYRDWMLDSGAYSVHNSGATIDLDAYIADCHRLRAEDPTLAEIIALDVIGNGAGSMVNAVKMRDAGLDVIPVHHIGESMELLKEYCSGFRKVGLSCRFGEPITESRRYLDRAFSAAWPHRFHSFGWAGKMPLEHYPFHSADASSWEVGPCAYGNWKTFGRMSVRGSAQALENEIAWYMELERKLRFQWRREMARLEGLP